MPPKIIATLRTRCGCRRKMELSEPRARIDVKLWSFLDLMDEQFTEEDINKRAAQSRRFVLMGHRQSRNGKFLFCDYRETVTD